MKKTLVIFIIAAALIVLAGAICMRLLSTPPNAAIPPRKEKKPPAAQTARNNPELQERQSPATSEGTTSTPKSGATTQSCETEKSPAKVEEAIKMLHDRQRDPETRCLALYELRDSKHWRRFVGDMAQVLADETDSWSLRTACVSHLARLAEKEADEKQRREMVALIKEAWTSRNSWVRARVLREMRNLKDAKAVEYAARVFADEQETIRVRDEAIRTLGELGARTNIPALREIARENRYDRLRAAAIVALGILGDQESRPLFAAAANSTNSELRNAGRFALSRVPVGEGQK